MDLLLSSGGEEKSPLPSTHVVLMLAALLILNMACVPPEERIELAIPDWCDTPRYEVVDRVSDGDTFDLGGGAGEAEEDFRLLGIQAPELASGEDSAQCYGPEAADLLEELLLGERVRLVFDVECQGFYGRTLAWVFLENPSPAALNTIDRIDGFPADTDIYNSDIDSVLINEVMIRSGYATRYQSDVAENKGYRELLEEAEFEAKELSRGLWGACD